MFNRKKLADRKGHKKNKAGEELLKKVLMKIDLAEQGLGWEYFNSLKLAWVPYEYNLKLTKEEYAVVKNLLIRFLRPLDDLKVDPEFKIWEECSESYGQKSMDKWPYEQAKAVLDRLVEQSFKTEKKNE